MRIDRLDLTAFGPFSGLSLDLTGPGLHVVYGANEAGKSTALRAVRAALFGVHGQTADAHRHDYKDLRIGMTVSGGRGADHAGPLAFVRRKGNKNTLLAPDETALPDDALTPYLGGTTEDAFRSQHAFSLTELVEGSEELLKDGGEVGQLLFASAGGLSHLRTVRAELQAEAAKLFKARGKNPLVNDRLRAFKATRNETKTESLVPTDWTEKADRIAALAATRDDLKRRAESTRAGAERARRLRAARGVADRLEEAESRRAALAAETAADAPLRAAAERIGRLTKRSAQAESAAADRPALVRQAAAATDAAAAALAALAPAGAGADWSPPDLSDPERAALAAAADRHAGLARERSEADAKRRAAATRAETLGQELEGAGALSEDAAEALAAAVDRAAALGEVAADAARRDREEGRLTTRLAAGLAKLPGFDGGAEELAPFPVPSAETAERCAADRSAAVEALREARAAVGRVEEELSRLAAERAALTAGGAVPSDADLAAARAARAAAWDRVCAVLTGDGPAKDEPAELIAEHSRRTAAADDTADALRREASRVQRAAALAADRARLDARATAAAAKRKTAEAALAAVDADWADRWPGGAAPPHPPGEMRAWFAAAEAVLSDHAALLAVREERSAAADRIAAAVADLAARLAEVDPDCGAGVPPAPSSSSAEDDAAERLAALRERARRALKAAQRRAGRRAGLETDLADARAARDAAAAAEGRARRELAASAADWAAATAPLGLSAAAPAGSLENGDEADGADAAGGPSTVLVRAFLDGWNAVSKRRDEAAGLRGRLDEIDAALAAFAADAAAAATDFAPDLLTRDGDADPSELVRVLADRLAAADRRAAEFSALPAEIAGLRGDLDVQRAGEPVDAFLEAVRSADPDALAARAETLEAELRDLDGRRDGAVEAVRDAEAELAALDRRGAAAQSEQAAQGLLAEIDEAADRYARLALADALLAAAAERHRRRHEGPVLGRAGRLFARLTNGRFAGLEVSFGAGDEPVLVGVRPAPPGSTDGGGTKPAELTTDKMSDGTRDALYLSLRLAGLAETAAGRPVPPLVVDDVLERLDDARTAAALASLAELADGSTGGAVQVILFTHHGRVAELAAALPAGSAAVHRLPTDHLPGPAVAEPSGAELVRTEPRAKSAPAPAPRRKPAAKADDGRQKALL